MLNRLSNHLGLADATRFRQTLQLFLLAATLVEAVRAISPVAAIELSHDQEWIRHAPNDLQ